MKAKYALVTGASEGMGLSFVRSLHQKDTISCWLPETLKN